MSIQTIITISRQFGSGGHEIGQLLSKQLDIPFYDKKLIELASKTSGIQQAYFENAEEHPPSSFLYSLSLAVPPTRFGEILTLLCQNRFLKRRQKRSGTPRHRVHA